MNRKRNHEKPEPNEPIAKGPDIAANGGDEMAAAEMPGQADDSQESATAAAESADPTAARLAKCEEDLKTMSERYLRLMAEYDKFRKRSQKEREALYLDSVAAVVKEWLPVVDNLVRAEQAALAAEGESARRIADGVCLVLKQASESLERLNVQEVSCLGEPFDPTLADAVLHVDDDSVGPSTVVEILQKGYACGDRIIRHCMVKVAN